MRKFDIRKLIILSLFDGIACGYEALLLAGFKDFIYCASEIEPSAIKIAKSNHPDINHFGDVRKLRGIDLWYVSIIIAGSPCQGFSIAGKKKGMTMETIMVTSLKQYLDLLHEGYKFKITKKNQSVLFWEFIRLKKEINEVRISKGLKPVHFLLENVTMNPFWEGIISDELGCTPIMINSKDVVPQFRKRNYWMDYPATYPEKLNPKLNTIADGAIAGIGWSGAQFPETGSKWIPTPSRNKFDVANCITTWPPTKKTPGRAYYTKKDIKITRTDAISLSIQEQIDKYDISPFTIEHLEGLQGLRKGYTNVPGVTEDQKRHALGNGWTVPVIAHLFKCLKIQLEKDYKNLRMTNEFKPESMMSLKIH